VQQGLCYKTYYLAEKIVLPGGQHVKLDNCKQQNVDMGLGSGTQTVIHMASSTVTMKTRLIREGDNHFVLQHPNWSCALSHSKRQNCDCIQLQVISSIPHTTENKDYLGNKTADQAAYIFTISDFGGDVYSGYGLMDIDAMWSVRWIKTFWRYTLPPSSGLRITQ